MEMDDRGGGSFVAVRRILQGFDRGNTCHSSSEVVAGSAAWLGRGLSCVCAQRRESDPRPSFDLTPAQNLQNYQKQETTKHCNCTIADVENVLAKFTWAKEAQKKMEKLKKEGKPLPKSMAEQWATNLVWSGRYVWEDHCPRSAVWKGTNGGEVISFSGCDDDQTSADTSALSKVTSTGAMTFSFIQAIERRHATTYGDMLTAMRSTIERVPGRRCAFLTWMLLVILFFLLEGSPELGGCMDLLKLA